MIGNHLSQGIHNSRPGGEGCPSFFGRMIPTIVLSFKYRKPNSPFFIKS
jgi:hypothetical protein